MNKLRNWLKKYFVPHDGNDFKPHFLRHESFTVLFLLIIIIELAFLAQVFLVFDKTKFLASVLPGVLTSLTNAERADNGAQPLTTNELLTRAAQMKADDMATNGYFAHTSPAGITPWYWFQQVGYKYSRAGENLAVNFFDSEDVAQAWMNSPTHRDNIVKKDYTEIGIGVANGIYQGRNTVFVAQLFGTPIQFPTQTQPAVQTPAQGTQVAQTPVAPVTPPTTPVKTNPTKPVIPTGLAQIPVSPSVAPRTTAAAPTSVTVLGEESNTNSGTVASTTSVFSKVYTSVKAFVQRVLTSPRESVGYIFGGIALLVLIALLFAYFIKFELAHPWSFLRGFSLFAVVIALLFININILNIQRTEVPQNDLNGANPLSGLSANAIEAVE